MARRDLVLKNNPLLSGPAMADREKSGIPYRVLDLKLIDRDPNQPRRDFDNERLSELSHSIKTYGVLSPLLVKPGPKPGRYSLISGERRFRAAQLAELTSVPVILDQQDGSSNERTLAIQLVENLQRAELTALERAHAIGALRDAHQLSVRDIADKLGLSKSAVQRSLEILELPDDLLNALKNGASESKVLLLAKIDDVEIRASYLKDLESLTRKDIEKNLRHKPTHEAGKDGLNAEDLRVVDEIQRAIGLKVKMSKHSPEADAGRLTIEFYSNQDLQEVFRRLVAD